MRTCRGKYAHTGFERSYTDFKGGSFDISTKRYKLFQTALEGPLSIFPHPTLKPTSQFHKLWFSHVTQQQLSPQAFSMNSPVAGSRAASTRKPGNQINQMFTPKGFHGHGFHRELFLGEMVSPQTSMPAAPEPGPLHLHTLISTTNLILGRRSAMWHISTIPCLSSPFTHHHRLL